MTRQVFVDSMYTHKNLPTLSTKLTLTTHTDFPSKYPAQLQTTSYNFSKTRSTNDLCVGVVKRTQLHEKNLSQHADDIAMVQAFDFAKSVFCKENSEEPKDIECIQVGGGADEGPSHLEVQFLWTERHISRPTRITMVTSCCSGDSYLNRVKLQNGCLSRGHAN